MGVDCGVLITLRRWKKKSQDVKRFIFKKNNEKMGGHWLPKSEKYHRGTKTFVTSSAWVNILLSSLGIHRAYFSWSSYFNYFFECADGVGRLVKEGSIGVCHCPLYATIYNPLRSGVVNCICFSHFLEDSGERRRSSSGLVQFSKSPTGTAHEIYYIYIYYSI